MLLIVIGGLVAAGCLGTTPDPGTAPASPTTTTTSPAGATAAVTYAKAQVGKPYCYAGVGPTCFDCSGLTLMAWKAGGLTLPRTSGAQFTKYPKVTLTALRPGDLLFPADPNQHVGMYVGNGRMVHATKTGDFIKDIPMSNYPVVYAVRPA